GGRDNSTSSEPEGPVAKSRKINNDAAETTYQEAPKPNEGESIKFSVELRSTTKAALNDPRPMPSWVLGLNLDLDSSEDSQGYLNSSSLFPFLALPSHSTRNCA